MTGSLVGAVDGETMVVEFQWEVEVLSDRTRVQSLSDARLVVGAGCLNFSVTDDVGSTKWL